MGLGNIETTHTFENLLLHRDNNLSLAVHCLNANTSAKAMIEIVVVLYSSVEETFPSFGLLIC